MQCHGLFSVLRGKRFFQAGIQLSVKGLLYKNTEFKQQAVLMSREKKLLLTFIPNQPDNITEENNVR